MTVGLSKFNKTSLNQKEEKPKRNEALVESIEAIRVVSKLLETSLGPTGSLKMVVDSVGSVTITNDGINLLKKIDVVHPAAKLLVETAKAQSSEVGDGTKSVVLFVNSLLQNAQKLIRMNIHPLIIIDGFLKASEKAKVILSKNARKLHSFDDVLMKSMILTALASKFIKSDRDHIANLVLESVSPYFTRNGKFTSFEINDIRIVKAIGGNITDSKFFNGVLLDKELLNDRMPKRIENASIALVNIPFKSETPKFEDKNNKIYINSVEEMKNLISKTNSLKKGKIDRLIRAGVNVVICQKEIDNFSQYYLTKNGIFAITEVKFTDLNKIEKISGAKVVATLEDFSEKYIGKSKYVEETKIGNKGYIFIEAYGEPKSTSILVRGGGLVLLNEIDLALQNALKVVREAILTPMILPGGGACETECYIKLNEWAKTIPSREQFAVQAFAQSLFDAITLNLARNCGLNEIQIETELRYRHKSGKINEGINVINKQIENMFESNIVEPFSIKNQVIDSAKEAASMILRIDEIVSSTAKPLPTVEKPPHFK